MLGSGILLASPKCALYGRISKINANLISVERNRARLPISNALYCSASRDFHAIALSAHSKSSSYSKIASIIDLLSSWLFMLPKATIISTCDF